jgi:hypothetical protein
MRPGRNPGRSFQSYMNSGSLPPVFLGGGFFFCACDRLTGFGFAGAVVAVAGDWTGAAGPTVTGGAGSAAVGANAASMGCPPSDPVVTGGVAVGAAAVAAGASVAVDEGKA